MDDLDKIHLEAINLLLKINKSGVLEDSVFAYDIEEFVKQLIKYNLNNHEAK